MPSAVLSFPVRYRSGIPQPRPRRARSAPARPPRSPRRPAPLPRSAAPPAGLGPTAMPPSRGARRSKPATPRASAQMPIFSPWGCSLGRRRQPFRPLSCFNSGRVHPIPLFQQLYAFTGPRSSCSPKRTRTMHARPRLQARVVGVAVGVARDSRPERSLPLPARLRADAPIRTRWSASSAGLITCRDCC